MSRCTQCGKNVPTKNDQSLNKHFVCGKTCNTSRFMYKEKNKDILIKNLNNDNRNSINSQCITCNIHISDTPIKLMRKHNMCTNCFNMSETNFNCELCNILYSDTHASFNKINRALCKQCRF
jgi:hypothetical protein